MVKQNDKSKRMDNTFSNNQSRFNTRNHRLEVEKRKKIYNEVIIKLGEAAVILFIDAVKAMILELEIKRLPSSLYWVDACYLFLHWLIFYKSFQDYEREYNYPHASAFRVVEFFLNNVKFSNKFFCN